MSGTGHDAQLMARAVALGASGRRSAPPNPWVACVIARDGEIVGEGVHVRAGRAHAEPLALAAAGSRARGATAYVTLEPCSHHGRTPPCVDTLIEAGVNRVVVALVDPDRKVAGKGIERLRDAGITVELGVGAEDAALDLAPYLHQRRTGRAYCIVKTATSLDGRVTAADGSSRWITGEAARADVHRLRADSQAIVVGSGTALADRPLLTARPVDASVEHPPLRVVLDGRGRVPADGPLFDTSEAPTLVCTSGDAPSHARDAWSGAGAKVVVLPADRAGGVDLRAVLEHLATEGVLQALVEGGPTLHGALVAGGLADHVVAYVAGTVLGPDGRAAFDAPLPPALADAPRLRLLGARPLGDDVRLDYLPRARAGES